MSQYNRQEEAHQLSHMLILVSYTVLSLGLMVETLLMSWELWTLPMIAVGVAACWLVHIRQRMNAHQRIWIYTTLIMGTFFFYGIHVTSTFDMSMLMMIVILIFTVTGESALVTCSQLTYFVTLTYDVIAMIRMGVVWDSLQISRLALHICLMLLAGWLARFIIRQWAQLFRDSDRQIAELDDTARRMNLFMANLSHELRTPVNAIMGTTNLVLSRDADLALRKEMATVRDAGHRLAEQVSDILDYSELETGQLVVNLEHFAISSLLYDLVAELKPRIPENLELVIDVEADVPTEVETDVGKLRKLMFHIIDNSLRYTKEGGVYVHISSMKQDYGINLCVTVKDTGIGMTEAEIERITQRFYQADSGKALRTGGLGLGMCIVSGFVSALGGFMTVESQPGTGTTVRLSIPQKVTDDRPCMSVDHRDRVSLGGYLSLQKYTNPHLREYYNAMIYDLVQGLGTPMHRVDNVEDLKRLLQKVSLTHLFVGDEEYLSAQALLESLARDIVVILVARDDFPLPAGSRVSLMPKPFYCFPVVRLLNADPHVAAEAYRMTCPGVRALVVDDEPMNLSVATGILRKYGMVVSTAASGAEAIRLCEDTPFDLVFMDHMMPEMDGVAAMKRIRQLPRAGQSELPVVALTANALSTAREMFIAEGFDGFIGKPIDISELERVLRRVLPKSAVVFETVQLTGVAKPEAVSLVESRRTRLAAGGIDMDAGLHFCLGDDALFTDLLRQFVLEAADKQAALSSFCAAGDFHNYAIHVHALKSTAAMIGAKALSEAARDLETSAKAGQADRVRARHAALLPEYARAVSAIRSTLEDAGPLSPAADDVMEFAPETDGVMEFAPETDGVMEFEPKGQDGDSRREAAP